MSDHLTVPQSIIDEIAIRKTVAQFADAAMRADRLAFSNLFSDDGVFEIGLPANRRAVGRAAIGELLGTLRKDQDFFVQYAQPGPIDVRGDHAIVRTLCYEMAKGPANHYYRNQGMFFDRLVRRGDAWLFEKRQYRYFWLDFSPFTGNAFSQLDAIAEFHL